MGTEIKKYLVFYGGDYYPSGGFGDFIGTFDSLIACYRAILKQHNKYCREPWEFNWFQIIDSNTLELVKHRRNGRSRY